MAKQYEIKYGKSKLLLSKSTELVGLKTKKNKALDSADFVRKRRYRNMGGFTVYSLNTPAITLDKKLDEVRQRKEVTVGTHVYYTEGSRRPLVPNGLLYIVFHEKTNAEEQNIVMEEMHLDLVKERGPHQIVARVTSKSPNPVKVAEILEQISMVNFVEPDFDSYIDEYAYQAPVDNLMQQQWHLKNGGVVPDNGYRLKPNADAKVIDAWQRLQGFGSSNIVISIIDNGFDTNHIDLRDRVHKPFDLWNNSSNLVQGDPTFTHGTPCASVALARVNGSGIVGAAPNAKFMPISGTSFSNWATEQMFEYAVKNGADIISCSWGTTDPAFSLNSLKEAAITKAARQGRKGKGAIILFAAGNEALDYVNYYGAHPDVICVGASTSRDEYSPYSNRGREVTICAPSNGDWPIIAARASWDLGTSLRGDGDYRYWADGVSRGNSYKHFGGTSSSTPLVAGICALMLSANPDLTAKQVKQILIDTADKIGQPWEYQNGHSLKYGHGRVNADKAVAAAMRMRDVVKQPKPQVEVQVTGGQGLFNFAVSKHPYKGWGVQTGVFAEYGNVLIEAERLSQMFNEKIVVNISELNGKTVYKIVCGSFTNKADAQKLQSRLMASGTNGFLRNFSAFA